MAFYVGCYLIQQEEIAPKHDRDSWAFPDAPTQHMGDTSNVEELLVDVEDMDVLPTQIQFGMDQWSAEDDPFSAPAFVQFYVRDEAFYVRGFVKGTELYSQFYVRSEFFYVRSFEAGTALYNEFYVRQEPFYLRMFVKGSGLYNEFYMREESFYIRSFSPVDFFYSIAEDSC
jgi:hypothetical protein